jgi:hypothetical protein
VFCRVAHDEMTGRVLRSRTRRGTAGDVGEAATPTLAFQRSSKRKLSAPHNAAKKSATPYRPPVQVQEEEEEDEEEDEGEEDEEEDGEEEYENELDQDEDEDEEQQDDEQEEEPYLPH